MRIPAYRTFFTFLQQCGQMSRSQRLIGFRHLSVCFHGIVPDTFHFLKSVALGLKICLCECFFSFFFVQRLLGITRRFPQRFDILVPGSQGCQPADFFFPPVLFRLQLLVCFLILFSLTLRCCSLLLSLFGFFQLLNCFLQFYFRLFPFVMGISGFFRPLAFAFFSA